MEPEMVSFPTKLGGPRTQNAQQIVLEKLKTIAEFRRQLEESLSIQKKEIEASTMPFLHDLIKGEYGGLQDTTNAICTKNLGVECRGNWDILGETNTTPTTADSNTSLEAMVEGEETHNSTTPLELASGDIDGVLGLTTPPLTKPLRMVMDLDSMGN